MTHSIKDDRLFINITGDAPAPLGNYSHAVKAGDFVFLCGLGARNPQSGKEVGVELDEHGDVLWYDIEVQTRQVMENMITVLKASGCQLTDVVDVTVYLKDMADFPKYNTVYGVYFSTPEKMPVRTTIQATPPGLNFVELKAVAYKKGSS